MRGVYIRYITHYFTTASKKQKTKKNKKQQGEKIIKNKENDIHTLTLRLSLLKVTKNSSIAKGYKNNAFLHQFFKILFLFLFIVHSSVIVPFSLSKRKANPYGLVCFKSTSW